MATYNELQEKFSKLKTEIVSSLQEILGDRTIEIEHEDEFNNNLVSMDKNSVYFNGGVEDYPLDELSIPDALQLLSIAEFDPELN